MSKLFYNLLANTLIVSVTNFTVWFAVTFFVYLQTRSVLATGLIAGIYLVTIAVTGIWFGSLVDHHKKKTIMMASSLVSLLFYAICFIIYQLAPEGTFSNPGNVLLWVFVILLLTGVITGNLRTIAMPTIVTILIPEKKRDKANGLVGMASGVSFLVTSVISGLLVAAGGMFYALILAMVVLLLSIIHLFFISLHEQGIVHLKDGEPKKVDIRGTLKVIFSIPGLMALIVFAALNNFLGGVFMALMDAYGLGLVSVQVWGFLWGILSTGFIIGGFIISKTGLGKNPLRTLLIINIIMWFVAMIFPIQSSIILLAAGMFIYMLLIPYAEASEQTVLQKVVPLNRQGRVFGFAQSFEQAASPLTAFFVAPLTQLFVVPFMSDGLGARLIGSWFGTGQNRAIALMFIITGVIGLLFTLWAINSKYYKRLSKRYLDGDAKIADVNLDKPVNEGLVQ